MKGYVLGFLFSPDKKHVVLINKTKPEWQAGKFNGVGGKIEQDESPYDAMVREFQEETGCYFTGWKEFGNMTNSQFIVHCYMGIGDGGEHIQSMTEEHVHKAKVDDVLTNQYNTIPNLKWLISMALDEGFEPVTITYHEADKYKEPTT